MEIRQIRIAELYEALRPFQPNRALFILMGGDRLSCCDEAIAAFEGNRFLGAATLSPYGDGHNVLDERLARHLGEPAKQAEPEIVGLWVAPLHRRHGVALALLVAAVERMTERGLVPAKIVALSATLLRQIGRLSPKLLAQLTVVDASEGTELFD